MPVKEPIIKYIKRMSGPVFSTREIAGISGKNLNAASQGLRNLAAHGVIRKLYRGVWAETGSTGLNPYALIPYIVGRGRAYVSFLSSLHLHGIIEQIPQTITLASTVHTKKIKTALGVFQLHKITPGFFFGFDWHKGSGGFLSADPEKAMADCLYLSTRRKNQYAHFPELHTGNNFSVKKTRDYLKKIPDEKARRAALKRLAEILR